MSTMKNLTGEVFDRLTVVKRAPNDKYGRAMWVCKCECGTMSIEHGSNLRSHKVRSCGCTRAKHHMNGTRPYHIWQGLRQRCANQNNKDYARYGGRGISFDDKWRTFDGFWKDMRDGYSDDLTIDRIDNSKGYYKDNCRWATIREQQNNMRSNRLLLYNGETKTLSQWSRALGIPTSTIFTRLQKGLPITRALRRAICE